MPISVGQSNTNSSTDSTVTRSTLSNAIMKSPNFQDAPPSVCHLCAPIIVLHRGDKTKTVAKDYPTTPSQDTPQQHLIAFCPIRFDEGKLRDQLRKCEEALKEVRPGPQGPELFMRKKLLEDRLSGKCLNVNWETVSPTSAAWEPLSPLRTRRRSNPSLGLNSPVNMFSFSHVRSHSDVGLRPFVQQTECVSPIPAPNTPSTPTGNNNADLCEYCVWDDYFGPLDEPQDKDDSTKEAATSESLPPRHTRSVKTEAYAQFVADNFNTYESWARSFQQRTVLLFEQGVPAENLLWRIRHVVAVNLMLSKSRWDWERVGRPYCVMYRQKLIQRGGVHPPNQSLMVCPTAAQYGVPRLPPIHLWGRPLPPTPRSPKVIITTNGTRHVKVKSRPTRKTTFIAPPRKSVPAPSPTSPRTTDYPQYTKRASLSSTSSPTSATFSRRRVLHSRASPAPSSPSSPITLLISPQRTSSFGALTSSPHLHHTSSAVVLAS
ncbi:hypothetical protein HK102_005756 [Quaeritorhiza haematococci]|nr:hypothetical protein HK102_005756 [Quaeritorhiza haematococci]